MYGFFFSKSKLTTRSSRDARMRSMLLRIRSPYTEALLNSQTKNSIIHSCLKISTGKEQTNWNRNYRETTPASGNSPLGPLASANIINYNETYFSRKPSVDWCAFQITTLPFNVVKYLRACYFNNFMMRPNSRRKMAPLCVTVGKIPPDVASLAG